MRLEIVSADIHLIDLQTRLPFKYGIATMTEAPHAFVRVIARIGGRDFTGVAADVLPPKWFTKIADKPLADEVAEMLDVIEHSVTWCVGQIAASPFDFWRALSAEQSTWAESKSYPALLAGFGVSLVERAVIECVAKSANKPFWQLVRGDEFGVRLGECDAQLAGLTVAELLPTGPTRKAIARHTVGMADPIEPTDIDDTERLDDGLPQALTECIERYALRHFKLKVSGDIHSDIDRLQQIANAIAPRVADFSFTLDGNEQFRDLEGFRGYWEQLTSADQLGEVSGQPFLNRLLFVEQPFHRDVALSKKLAALKDWADRPQLIIDESDADLGSLPQALALGYHGTSHKNCKGVFKSIINACRLAMLARRDPNASPILSGEDLANIGPIALLQDLSVAAALGVASIERNGHHYFAGLSAFPAEVQQQTLQSHGDLYRNSNAGWPTLNIRDGQLDLSSVNAAPLGVGFDLDVEQFTSLRTWQTQQ